MPPSRLDQAGTRLACIRIPLPVTDADDFAKLRDRSAHYATRPDDLAAALERDRELAELRRVTRDDFVRQLWLYGGEG